MIRNNNIGIEHIPEIFHGHGSSINTSIEVIDSNKDVTRALKKPFSDNPLFHSKIRNIRVPTTIAADTRITSKQSVAKFLHRDSPHLRWSRGR